MFLKLLADKTVIAGFLIIAHAAKPVAGQLAEPGPCNFSHQLVANGVAKFAERSHAHQKGSVTAYDAMTVVGVYV